MNIMKETSDLPKVWQDPDEVQEVIPVEVIPEEEIQLPSIDEQRDIVASSNLSNTNKSLLESLVTMNEVAQTLEKIKYTETADLRMTYIKMLAENFISSRMGNNQLAEELKRRLILRLLDHVDMLDFELLTRLYNDLHETTNLDSQQAFGMITGANGTNAGFMGGGTTVNLNLATGEGGTVNTQVNQSVQQAGQLKEVQTMNTSIKSWANSNIPLPKRKQE